MINPEKLLGGLLNMGLDKKSKKKVKHTLSGSFATGTKAAIGLGVLGVAMAAFDHYMEQKNSATATPSGTPGWNPQTQSTATPPPPPGIPTSPPPPPTASISPAANEEAVLLLRAMIASAYADGILDAEERKRIVEKLEEVGLTPEERLFVTNELLNPADIQILVQQANTSERKQQVYAVSLLAIDLDTDTEKAYLASLAQQLSLDPETVQQIHTQLGIET